MRHKIKVLNFSLAFKFFNSLFYESLFLVIQGKCSRKKREYKENARIKREYKEKARVKKGVQGKGSRKKGSTRKRLA